MEYPFMLPTCKTADPHGLTPNLNKALSQAQEELPKVTKNKKGSSKLVSTYASLDQVLTDIYPVLKKYELFINGEPIYLIERDQWIIRCTLGHSSGEERYSYAEHVLDKNQMNTNFAWGGSITYRLRYLIPKMLGLVIEEEDIESSHQEMPFKQSAPQEFTPRQTEQIPFKAAPTKWQLIKQLRANAIWDTMMEKAICEDFGVTSLENMTVANLESAIKKIASIQKD